MQIVEALKLLGVGPAAEAEVRRLERQGKRPREPEPAAAPVANKQIKLDPRLTHQQVTCIKMGHLLCCAALHWMAAQPTPASAAAPATNKQNKLDP